MTSAADRRTCMWVSSPNRRGLPLWSRELLIMLVAPPVVGELVALPARSRRSACSQLAGSARIGSNASSAAPSSGASTPSFAGTISTSERGAARARRSSSPSTVAATKGWSTARRPPRTMRAGLSVLTRPARPIPSHWPVASSASSAPASPASASASTASTAAVPPSAGRPARTRSASSPTSVSQQPTEPHRQVAPASGLTGRWPTSPP